jgi:hypothetical protein
MLNKRVGYAVSLIVLAWVALAVAIKSPLQKNGEYVFLCLSTGVNGANTPGHEQR